MLKTTSSWNPPKHWLRVKTVDTHTEGEPLRIVLEGFPELRGDTILERRQDAKARHDHVRRALMWEPRGHADMYGCILTPPVTSGADFGVLFTHNEGYSTMCGHGIIGVTKAVLEIGLLPMQAPLTTVKIDSPAGLITSHARIEGGRVKSVYFENVPSFVLALDETIDVAGLGRVRYDLAFGGAFYAFVQASSVNLSLTPENYRLIIDKGMAIKRAVMQRRPLAHPFEADLSFLYGTIFTAPPLSSDADSRNVCVFADGEVDRSPTGTGVSARMAIHYARGEVRVGQDLVIESILGTRFTGRVARTTELGPYPAVIPEVEGTAFLTGRHEFFVDPEDPLKEGFFLR